MQVDRPVDKVKIAGKLIGKGEACFIIAEAGVNHNGDINLAKKLIDIAKEAGADAVKFQTLKAEELVTRNAEKAGYQKRTTPSEESQYDMLKKLELSREDFKELFVYSRDKGILFLSSPFDKESVDLLSELGVAAFKVPSGEITNFPLLKHIASKSKPIILSTGMATLEEVEKAVGVIKREGVEDIILLHCVSNYPAKVEDMNLRAMETLRDTFRLPVGLSDHSLGITIPIAAAVLGACVIEKHFTTDKNLPGPDHQASLEPHELQDMIAGIRTVELALGSGAKRPVQSEADNRLIIRRSLAAACNIPKGTVISLDMLKALRPASGISPALIEKVVGYRAKHSLVAGQLINWGDLE